MFDFAISQNRKAPPTGRMITSWIASCLIHGALLIIMIENPQLMRLGTGRWLQSIMVYSEPAPDQNWRVVTVLRTPRMQGPSAATLKKYMKDWGAEGSGSAPPIRVRWGNEKETKEDAAVPKPAPPAKPVPGVQEPKPIQSAAASDPGSAPETAPPPPVSATPQGASNSPTVFLPAAREAPPVPKKVPETTPSTTAPATIPDSRASSPSTPSPKPTDSAQQSAKPFDNAQKAIHTEGSGLFDTKGFPLGDYANVVIERVKGNWSIPSNLRHSQGRTTVIFFIDKDGRPTDARIVIQSGNSSLDLAALSAILGSNPFPPLPKGFPGDHVGAKFVFSYNERQ